MATTTHSSEAALPRGAAMLSAHQLDQVAGGSVYYELCFRLGEWIGEAERHYLNFIEANGGAEYYYL